MIYTVEHFEYIPARELLENHHRWISGNSERMDEYVAHKIRKVEEVDGIVYIDYTMREGVQDFHETRRNDFRVTRVSFLGGKPTAEVELQAPPDEQIFVLKSEFEPERDIVESEE